MTNRTIALIFYGGIGLLGCLGLYTFLDELETDRDVHALLLSALVTIVGLFCIYQFLRLIFFQK